MKRIGKPVFFIVTALILAFTIVSATGMHSTWGDTTYTYIKGIGDIRWGTDVQGGVEVVFSPADPANTTNEQLEESKAVIEKRLSSNNITGGQTYVDYDKQQIVVSFPMPTNKDDFNVDEFVKELAAKADLTFRKGTDKDENGAPTGEVVLTEADVESATVGLQIVDEYSMQTEYAVQIDFTDEGTQKFATVTGELAESGGQIAIWLDDKLLSAPTVDTAITEGTAAITGDFTAEDANELANTINTGSLPIVLNVNTYSTVSPTLGDNAREMLAFAAVISFLLILAFIIWRYKLIGFCSSIALIGHASAALAAVSGFFGIFDSFTLTLPGMVGIALGLGLGVEATVLTAYRVKEEVDAGRSIDASVTAGAKRGFSDILGINVAALLISIILMIVFGGVFGNASGEAVFSFGYTLLIGVICNLVFNVFCLRLMLRSISKFKRFRKLEYYGGEQA